MTEIEIKEKSEEIISKINKYKHQEILINRTKNIIKVIGTLAFLGLETASVVISFLIPASLTERPSKFLLPILIGTTGVIEILGLIITEIIFEKWENNTREKYIFR